MNSVDLCGLSISIWGKKNNFVYLFMKILIQIPDHISEKLIDLVREIGERFNLIREWIRQIKEKALRRLRHVSRSKALRAFLA